MLTVNKPLVSFLCSLPFYIVLFKLFSYLFKKIDKNENLPQEGDKGYFRRDLLIAIIFYCFCTLLFFQPCLKNIANFLIGPPEDNMQHFWDIWWFNKALSEPDIALSFSNYIYYPEGSSLLLHAFSFYNLFISLFLMPIFNRVIVYNLLILHSFLLSGIGAFLLTRYLTKNSWASLIGGFIFAFSPFHFAHALHHLPISSIQFIPFFVLFFIKAIKNNSKRDLFLAGLFFFLNSISSWYYFFFAICFIGFSYIYLMWRSKQIFLKKVILKSTLIVGITIIILLPWFFRMGVTILKNPQAIQRGHNCFVVDTLALFVPDNYHWLANLKLVKNINDRFTGIDWEKTAYLGIINIVIMALAFKQTIRKTAKFFLGFFASLVISMGASIHILGWVSLVRLPYTIISHMPIFLNARCPSRFLSFVYLFWAVIIAFSLKFLMDAYKSTIKGKFLFCGLILLLFFDYYPKPFPLTKVYLPSCYNAIKKEEKIFGILDLPFEEYSDRERYMMYQTFHGFPIVTGQISRTIEEPPRFYSLELKNLCKQKEYLLRSNVKYIVIHKKMLPLSSAINIKEYLNYYKVIYTDEDNTVLQVYDEKI